MRLSDLQNVEDSRAWVSIVKCPRIELKEAIANPGPIAGKVVVFYGNYGGFDTNRLCVRAFEYLAGEGRWKVSDRTVYDSFEESFEHHFAKHEIEKEFIDFFKAKGFIMDA